MKLKGCKKAAAIISIAAITTAMGLTAFATDSTTGTTADNGKSAIWNILTEDQKAQLLADAKTRLAQDLADGKITQEQYDSRLASIESGEMPFGKGGRGGMGDNTAVSEMKSKWDALTDAQKAEIYTLYDQKTSIESQIVDKYLEFGVIDSETAATMKSNLETQKSDMRTNGRMPMVGGKGSRGPKTSSNSTVSSDSTASTAM